MDLGVCTFRRILDLDFNYLFLIPEDKGIKDNSPFLGNKSNILLH